MVVKPCGHSGHSFDSLRRNDRRNCTRHFGSMSLCPVGARGLFFTFQKESLLHASHHNFFFLGANQRILYQSTTTRMISPSPSHQCPTTGAVSASANAVLRGAAAPRNSLVNLLSYNHGPSSRMTQHTRTSSPLSQDQEYASSEDRSLSMSRLRNVLNDALFLVEDCSFEDSLPTPARRSSTMSSGVTTEKGLPLPSPSQQ